MRAAPFTYHRPTSLADALALCASLDDARVLAGGQTLMPMVAMRVAQPAHLIDLNGIEGLNTVTIADGHVRIGAMVRQTTLLRAEDLARDVPMLREALNHVGHRATRNRGTLGGSLCHLDPAAELPVVMAALDARLTLASPAGTRTLAFADFAADALSPALATGEILTQIGFDLPPSGGGQAFLEVAPRFGATALVSVAALVARDADGGLAMVRIALGGATAVPMRLAVLEHAVIEHGAPCSPDLVASTLAPLDILDDALVASAYRRAVAATLVCRAVSIAFDRAHRSGPT